MYGVILAGGRGRRFWPYSRAAKPKQFLDVTGEGSMLALTWRRLTEFIPPDRVFVITLEDLVPLIRRELPALARKNIFTEPVGRNTAPAIAMAATLVQNRAGDEPFLTCPADHMITRKAAFRRVVMAASRIAADRDELVTFGVVPSYPATGYGYIESSTAVAEARGVTFLRAKKFREKPAPRTAVRYCASKRYFWNSGIFLWRPSVYLRAWSRFLPEGEAPRAAIEASLGTALARRVIGREYPKMPAISVDYGILEKAANVVVAPASIGWSDVGSWDSLFDLLPRDGRGNAGAGFLALVDSRNNLFFNPGGVTAAAGVDDTIVVVDGKTVLVCKRGDSQRVREITALLEKKNRNESL